MVLIPEFKPITTVDKIYEAYEIDTEIEDNDITKVRGHLGASLIGLECDRKIWYSHRWATKAKFSGRMLRLFETGQMAEHRFTANLRRIGVTVEDVDPATDKQWSVRDASGHFGGSLDGKGWGFVEAPKTVHVLEYKTHNEKSFKDLIKNKVAHSKPQHYAQMQVYMHLMGLQRAFYLAVNKNTDELYQERIYYDVEYATRLTVRANNIINNPNPPERISNDPSWHQCKLCDHSAVCYGSAVPPRHCRSCVFSTPVENGEWYCNKHNTNISLQTQKVGCNYHRYLPRLLVALEQTDVGADFAWIEYTLPTGSKWRDIGQ